MQLCFFICFADNFCSGGPILENYGSLDSSQQDPSIGTIFSQKYPCSKFCILQPDWTWEKYKKFSKSNFFLQKVLNKKICEFAVFCMHLE